MDSMKISEAMTVALEMAREAAADEAGVYGHGVVELIGADGRTKRLVPFANKITDTGDAYLAAKSIALVPPANAAAPTALTGMQIGSGSTAAAKSGAGGAMVTLLAGQAFDSGFPQTTNLGAGAGVQGTYKTTFAAGVGTGTVQEVTVTNGTIGTASTAGNTIARVVISSVVKGAADSLAVTYAQTFLG